MGRKNKRMKTRVPSLRKIERMIFHPMRMEIWFADLPKTRESCEQYGTRPVVIVSNDITNAWANTVTVIPVTSREKHVDQPTHVVLDFKESTTPFSMALVEQITTIDKRRLIHKIGECKASEPEIEAAIKEQLGLHEKAEETAERKKK